MISATSWPRLLALGAAWCVAGVARPAEAAGPRVGFERVAVRYFSAETGGPDAPRFFFDRELAFFVRVEALRGEGKLASDYVNRYLTATVERLIAEEMLSTLQVQRGLEPPRFLDLVDGARQDLATSVGGADRLAAVMRAEGISDGELNAWLRTRTRALYYVDQNLTPIVNPSEDELSSAFRTTAHPLRAQKYEAVRSQFLRWYVDARFRSLELDFLQGAKSRITITYL